MSNIAKISMCMMLTPHSQDLFTFAGALHILGAVEMFLSIRLFQKFYYYASSCDAAPVVPNI